VPDPCPAVVLPAEEVALPAPLGPVPDPVEPVDVEPVAPVDVPLPIPGVPRPLLAVVPTPLRDELAGFPSSAPVVAPGACGSHGLSGVARWPVVGVVLVPRCCVDGVVPVGELVLWATAGAASAAASAAPPNAVISPLRFMKNPPELSCPGRHSANETPSHTNRSYQWLGSRRPYVKKGVEIEISTPFAVDLFGRVDA